jgi:NOL1/NOP2/sun family putative RNA methylase
MNQEYLQRMKEMLKDEYEAYEESLDRPLRRGFRVNPLKCTDEELFAWMDLDHEKSPFAKHGYYTDAKAGIGFTPAYLSGMFYMQEPSASAAVTVLDPQPGMMVADLCAAPGSKSTQILELLQDQGMLVSNEIDGRRCQILNENVERNGAPNAVILNADTKDIADAFPCFFDAVLCDAPCSGEGMFRKSEDAVNDWSQANVEKCAALQKEILENAYRCLKPGGTLVYSTCTFSKQEDEMNAAWFLHQHEDMEIEPIDVPFGRHAFDCGCGTEKALRIFPMDGGEGHFICRMHKQGDAGAEKHRMMQGTAVSKEILAQIDAILAEPYPYIYQKNDRIYGGIAPFYDCGRCHISRYQVYLGEVKKNNRFEPDHAMAMSVISRFRIQAELDDEMLAKYMHGEQLPIVCEKGFCALTWHGIAVGLGKSDGRCIKNKYPKRLRTR